MIQKLVELVFGNYGANKLASFVENTYLMLRKEDLTCNPLPKWS